MLARLDSIPQLSGAVPVIGHLAKMQDRMRFVQHLGSEVDRLIRVRSLGRLPLVAVNHPDTIQELLVERHRVFEKSGMIRFSLYPLAGEGLFTSRGDLWKKQRRLMAPLFHPNKLASFGDDMVACADRTISSWTDGEERTLLRDTTRITMSVAGKTLFQADTFGEADDIGEALTTALDFVADNSPSVLSMSHLIVQAFLRNIAKRTKAPKLHALATRFERPLFVPGAQGRRLRKAIAFLDETVQRMIDTRRASGESHGDLLSRLLEVRDEDDGEHMSDKQVRDEVLTLFVAGHETTATALAWSIYLLGRNPDIYDAAQAEADALGHTPTAADLPRLPLMLRIFKESLRLYPPVYFDGRQAASATSLDGVECPAGTVVMFSPYTLHRRPDLWADPERFDPDRFLPEAEAARSRYAWLPFGAGPRICIGMGFALMEGQLILARMLQRARYTLLADEVPEPSATLRPRHGVPVKVTLRG
ncbi:MAG: cytochrome P450 [Polyangia bacterium]